MFNQTKKSALTTAFAGIWFFSSALLAEEQSLTAKTVDNIRDPFYVGLGVGTSFLKPEPNSVALNVSQDSDFAYKVFGGYQFTDNWAAEVFWSDMGRAEISSATTVVGIVDYQAFGVGGLFQYPVSDNWDVFATAGVGRLRNRFQVIEAERVEDSFIYAGGGVMWNFAKTWDMRAEYDFYDSDAQMLSFNIVKRFGSATSKRIARLENKVQQQEAVIVSDHSISPLATTKQASCEDYSVELKDLVIAKHSVELTAKSKTILDKLAKKLIVLPEGIQFEIRAHTDNTGTELYNYSLSLARARIVRDYLAAQGIALSRLDAQGYGEWRPLKSNQSKAGRDANRRAELLLLGVEKYVENTSNCLSLAPP